MALRDTIRQLADRLGIPAFSGTPYPTGDVEAKRELGAELGGSGTFNFGGFIRGEDFNPEMDSLTAIKNLDIMRRSDAQVNAALQVVTLPIRSADKSVDPAVIDDSHEPTEEDTAVAKFVEWNLFGGESIVWDDFLRQALLMLAFGHYVFEKVWDIQKTGPYAGQLYYRKLAPRPPKTIWQWFVDESGELLSVKQLAVKAGTYQFLDIPASKLVVFVNDKEGDNYAGRSILRTAYPHWKIKSNLYVVDAIRAVRYGAGIPRASLQKGYAPNQQEKLNLINTLSGMSSNQFSYIIQPENVEIDILTPKSAKGGAEILSTIEHHNQQITRNVLATFLDMGGRDMGGSNALGSSAMDFFSNAVTSVADLVQDVLNKQVIRPLVDANFDVNKLSGYPTFRFSGIKRDDLKSIAEVVASLAGAGMVFSDIETQNTFRQRLGLPEVTEEMLAQAAPPVPDGGVDPTADPSAPPSGGPGGAPRTPPTNQNPQGMRPAVMPGERQAAKTAVNQDHTETVARAGGPGQKGAVAVASNARRPVATSKATTTASSGDADEEGHTQTVGSKTKSQRVAAVSASDRETIERPEILVDGAFWRQPTDLETRVLDLKEIPRKLDTARDALLATLDDIREEQILRIAEAVSRLPVGATPPKPPLVGKLTSDVWRIIEDVFNYGHDSVEKELQKQGAENVSGRSTPMVFADATDMPFPVELSPYPEPSREDVAGAPVVRVELAKLVATQASLTQRRVLPEKLDTSLPIVVVHEGVYRIYDGHHRLAHAKENGAKAARCRVVAMSEIAMAAPKTKERALPHLEAGMKLRVQTASEKLVSKALFEALRLKRSGWTEEEIEDALKIHLGDASKADLKRFATMSVNEAFAIGRNTAAEGNVSKIGYATLSALMDAATCSVCRSLDGKKYKIGTDEYEEHLPPLQGCKGKDHCRCVYIYTFDGAAAMREVALGGPGSGWTAEDGHVPGSQGGRKGRQVLEVVNAWAGDADNYHLMRDPRTSEGQAFEKAVANLSNYQGTVYRGTSISDQELADIASKDGFELKLHSSTSKEKDIAYDFMTQAAGRRKILFELQVTSSKDISSLVKGDVDQHEVIVLGGTRFRRIAPVRKFQHPEFGEVYKIVAREDAAVKLAEALSFGGPGSGWFREKGHISHKHKDEKSVLKPSKERAFTGSQTDGPRMSKLETGQLGEQIAILYLKQMGHADARTAHTGRNNYAVDVVTKHTAYEVKTGLSSNGPSAHHWRATIGQPGPKEQAWLAKASPEAKARWNARKANEIMIRKKAAVKELSQKTGRKLAGKTLTMVINAKTRTVDVHEFDGFHARIPWKSDQARKGYKGSFKY